MTGHLLWFCPWVTHVHSACPGPAQLQRSGSLSLSWSVANTLPPQAPALQA